MVRKDVFVRSSVLVLLLFWVAIYFASLFAPPLLDDADATHANAARNILFTHDFVTLKVNGVRYLEKAPLPYWLVAGSFALLGVNTFAAHLPQALAVLALALLAFRWARKTWNSRAGLYSGVAILTSAGVFLFTRIFIPEVLLSVFLAGALYVFHRALERKSHPRTMSVAYALLALGVLTKGLIAIVFPVGTAFIYLWLTAEWSRWRELRPFSGTTLFLLIATPWHILAGLRNTGGYHGHGFFWFYFVNEHFMRFLGRRIPRDYNKLPGTLFWLLHLVWIFPWSLFFPAAAALAWGNRERFSRIRDDERVRVVVLLGIFAVLVLLFFSISTNQEYYTFPAYLPICMLTGAAMATIEHKLEFRPWLTGAHVAFAAIGATVSVLLFSGLWSARHLPYQPDIGEALAHRGVGDYTLSMSHFFDLTGPSFAALRLPAAMAAFALAVGPIAAWLLRHRGRPQASTLMIAFTSALFLIAAHIALVRFAPMLSSQALAKTFSEDERNGRIEPSSELMLYGDQAYGSSIPFYTKRVVPLVEGRSTSMWFGSTFPDAPHIFLTNKDLLAGWGKGPRKVLFVPEEKRSAVDALLGQREVVIAEISGKALVTDRPLLR